MKTLIIGNGSSVREHKLGNKIDSFDVVVRFNRGYFEGIKGYEEYVGSKTDVLIVHDGYAKPDYLTDGILNSVKDVLVVTPKFKIANEFQRIQSYGCRRFSTIIWKYDDRKKVSWNVWNFWSIFFFSK